MTDNEIIKALECCATDDGDDCFQCPYGNIVYKSANGGCVNRCRKDALDLINRQKAEIERLLQKLQQAKSEAIKEFAERLTTKIMNHVVYKNDCHNFSGNPEYLIRMVTVCDYITDIVKEMTEVEE